MKRTSSLLVLAFFVLLLNSAYLYAFATPSLFYFTNVGLHAILGIALLVAFVPVLARRVASSGVLFLLATLLLLGGGGLGVYLTIHGATRDFRWALLPHILTTAAGALLMVVHLYRRSQEPGCTWSRTWVNAGAAVVAISVALPLGVRLSAPKVPREEMIVNPTVVAQTMEGEGAGPQSPFFPSSANTNVNGIIPSNFFMHSESCGRCHTEIYKQWKSSAHHFSSFNNQWYRKSIEYMQDTVGTKPSKWCAGCHDHAVFFNGRFDKPIKEQIHTPEAQAGLACTSCHAIVHVKSTMGQGDFDIEYPPLHDLAVSDNKILAYAHDKLLELDPEPHKQTFLKAFHRQQSPEFCSSCHKVHLDIPVNKYRWFRGFNEYDAWQASGVSGEGARSFYYPAKPMKCVQCHMPLVEGKDPASVDGKIHSHRFPAANTALPFVNKDPEQLKVVQNFLRDGQISVDVFGIVRTAASEESGHEKRPSGNEPELSTSFGQGEESNSMGAASAIMLPPAEVLGPIDKVVPTVRRGDSVRVEVVVRTRKVGHIFPGGTVDAFDVWVELEAVDDKGKTIFHSGSVADDGNGPVEPGAHFYRAFLLDEHGNHINKRNAWSARSVAYVRLIPPGAADTIHYRLDIPADCGDKITLRAKVNYRKFSWWNTQFAFAGVRDPQQEPKPSITADHDDSKWVFTGDTSDVSGEIKAIPSIPTTVMAEKEAVLKVAAKGATLPDDKPYFDKSVRERWNDYGIGLLLQGDIKGAEAAFLNVTKMEPGYADGWVNVARARVQEGQMLAAEPVLRKALEIDPKLAKTHFFLAMALKPQGQYDEAISHLRTALEQYPRDRVVRNQLGRVLFLKREFKDAVAEFQKVLAIDPEDLQAHYNLMLCYQGLGDTEATERERTLYQRFKADESAQAITGPYRQLHPEDNNERQSIHEHRSGPLGPASKPKYDAPQQQAKKDDAKRVAESR
jgi:tetratricopeptide (TPR) repeat protein